MCVNEPPAQPVFQPKEQESRSPWEPSASSPSGELTEAAKALSPSGESAEAAEALSPSGEPAEAAEALSPSGEPAEAAEALSPSGEPAEAAEALSPSDGLTDADEAFSLSDGLTDAEAEEEQEDSLPAGVDPLPTDSLFTDTGADPIQICRAMEALLFVAAEPLPSPLLAQLIGVERADIERAALELGELYANRGLLLRRVAGGWQFVTAPEFSPLIQKLYRPKFQQLSAAAMETLAIVAYRQPITRAEISDIRHVDCDGVVTTLLEKNLICEVGRLTGAGRAILYGTSKEFLKFFGINSVTELPQLEGEEQTSLPI